MNRLEISGRMRRVGADAEASLESTFHRIDEIALANTEKVMAAFQKERVSEGCFAGTTGYGYDDKGRETLERIFADVFGTEAALVRTSFANGTHAITCALFSALGPGDVLLSATGLPYDTLQTAIGITGTAHGSLRYYGIEYRQTDLLPDGRPNLAAIEIAASDSRVKAVEIQRSRGYAGRPSFSPETIGEICDLVHRVNPGAAVIVDNCYGEFTALKEPSELGADLIAGSLIKNPGGGIAPSGGYIAGRRDLVENAASRLTSPGIGGEVGATLGSNRLLFQGFFLAPHVTAQAEKTAVFCAKVMELLGYETSPRSDEARFDIIQTVELKTPEGLSRFCRGIQSGAPVDSYVTPEPWAMPGYEDQVIMAAGAFIQGASIELSADGPMREPYRVFIQGGVTFESGKLGVLTAADLLTKDEDELSAFR